MVNLLMRRRGMMATPPVPSPIPSGYIKNGLVFFLDGKQQVSASAWTDIVGGKTFTLYNCTLGTDGVVFDNSTAYGEYSGTITSNVTNETIEVVVERVGDFGGDGILMQPYDTDNATLGISCVFTYSGSSARFIWRLNETSGKMYQPGTTSSMPAVMRVGMTASVFVLNGTKYTATASSSRTANKMGVTMLGARRSTGAPSNFFNGTIKAVRIYNRKLSEAEIKANQAVDLTYYNLS